MASRRRRHGCPISRAFCARELGSSNALSHQMARVVGVLAVVLLALAAQLAPKQSAPPLRQRYLSPIEMAFSADGRFLYVVCQDSDEIRVVDVPSGKVVNSFPVGRVP